MDKTIKTTVATLSWLAISMAALAVLLPTDVSAEVDGTVTRTASSTVETVTVGPTLVDCVGVAPQKCMIVDGSNFYDTIAGFEYETGYTYTLEITKTERANPPADASAYEYALVEVVSKTPVVVTPVTPDDAVLTRLQTMLDGVIATYLQIGEWKIDGGGTATFSDGRIAANVGCNQMGAGYELSGKDIKVAAVVSTKMFCMDEGVMEREQAFATALAGADTFRLTTTGVILSGDEGEVTLVR